MQVEGEEETTQSMIKSDSPPTKKSFSIFKSKPIELETQKYRTYNILPDEYFDFIKDLPKTLVFDFDGVLNYTAPLSKLNAVLDLFTIDRNLIYKSGFSNTKVGYSLDIDTNKFKNLSDKFKEEIKEEYQNLLKARDKFLNSTLTFDELNRVDTVRPKVYSVPTQDYDLSMILSLGLELIRVSYYRNFFFIDTDIKEKNFILLENVQNLRSNFTNLFNKLTEYKRNIVIATNSSKFTVLYVLNVAFLKPIDIEGLINECKDNDIKPYILDKISFLILDPLILKKSQYGPLYSTTLQLGSDIDRLVDGKSIGKTDYISIVKDYYKNDDILFIDDNIENIKNTNVKYKLFFNYKYDDKKVIATFKNDTEAEKFNNYYGNNLLDIFSAITINVLIFRLSYFSKKYKKSHIYI